MEVVEVVGLRVVVSEIVHNDDSVGKLVEGEIEWREEERLVNLA